jgi:hypothetical protein
VNVFLTKKTLGNWQSSLECHAREHRMARPESFAVLELSHKNSCIESYASIRRSLRPHGLRLKVRRLSFPLLNYFAARPKDILGASGMEGARFRARMSGVGPDRCETAIRLESGQRKADVPGARSKRRR